MPVRFAILHHTGIADPHFDLLFETFTGSDLVCFRLPTWPIAAPSSARRLKDHRRLYLDFEGEISGNRGSVECVGRGTCEAEVLANRAWRVRFISGVRPQTLDLRPGDQTTWTVRPLGEYESPGDCASPGH